MKFLSVAGIALLLSGCVASSDNYQSIGVQTNIQAVQFNSILSQYRTRPTFLSIITHNGKQTLMLEMSRYSGYTAEIPFIQTKVSDYVLLIDKFIKWTELANEKGDIFTKELGQVDGNMVYVTFTFHSANASSTYLSLSYCVKNNFISDVCFDNRTIDLAPDEAINLKRALISFEKGKLIVSDINKSYN